MDTTEKRNRKSPAETASYLSLLFFGWTVPILWRCLKYEFTLADLYDPLRSDESERLGDGLEREWNRELKNARKADINEGKSPARQPSLMWAITRKFGVPYMVTGLVYLVYAMFSVLQPILLGWVISYFDEGQEVMTRGRVLLYAGVLTILTVVMALMNIHILLYNRYVGMRVRVACCSMIYRKVLRLNQSAVNGMAAGRIANLISNDVGRFDLICIFFHHLWITPIQMFVIGYIMWKTAGASTLVGMGALIMQTIPLQGFMSSLCAKLRAKSASKTDERVQLICELLSGIQVVKMYSWEKPLGIIISKVRDMEMKFISYTSYMFGIIVSVSVWSQKVSLYISLITLVLLGHAITPEITFTLVGLFALLQRNCNTFLPKAILISGETCVALERITEFLLLDEIECTKNLNLTAENGQHDVERTGLSQKNVPQVGIEMIKVTANWVQDRLPPTLSDISLKIESQSLCAIVGPVGSGKSSLLHLVLGELPVQNGKLSLITDMTSSMKTITSQDIRISYASQDPWLFSATIRDNIIFGQQYNETRYHEVTSVCGLLKDFEQLPQGDLSLVGERGVILSGGQRARVNLARAIYRDADLYLLDDPLSAVDPRVGRQLFGECITGFLKNKTRILVTHQLQYLQQVDTVVVLDHGTVKCQGTYDELVKKDVHVASFGVLDEPDQVNNTAGVNQEEKMECKITTINSGAGNELSDVTGSSSEESSSITMGRNLNETLSKEVYWQYFLAGGNMCSLVFTAGLCVAGQIAVSGSDYWVSYWTNQEALRSTRCMNQSVAEDMMYRNQTEDGHGEMHFRESQWFDENGLLRENLGIYVYTVFIIGCVVLNTLRSVFFMRMCMNASRNLHYSMCTNLLRATMRFFNINPSGRIVNRFTKDVGSMDQVLPNVMLEALQAVSLTLGVFTVIAIANNWMILPAVVLAGLYYTGRKYYLKTGQNLKRLEGITKSPMFSQINSTLDGLATIRSAGASVEDLLRKEFDRYQNMHTGVWHLNISTTAAFAYSLDLVSCGFLACVCFVFILMDAGDTLGTVVGLAISQSLVLTNSVQYGVRQSADLISEMTAVERILEYTKLPKEGPFTTDNPPPSTWPSKGGLILRDVSMKYTSHEPPVLKNLNVTINPGWKVGIVGRTGAGKSSLISALFRLTGDGLEGEIVLDGIDTKSIGLHELRPRISIIPQEPILFSASLRYNLDPFEQYSDAELWDSLREVELGDAVPSLDFLVAGGGANFSVGQRQLICLARAILRNNRILVLDEATANVDHGTDALIQKTIRHKFADCTVLTIAHRLNTIMDSDRVLVMRDGCIVEFDHPHLLLKNRDGHFSRMLHQTGEKNALNLAEIAETSFLLDPEFRKNPDTPPSQLSLPEQMQ